MNWRGRPLTDIRTIVELIAATTTSTGLSVHCAYDSNWYPTGEKTATPTTPPSLSAATDWHGDWNYDISA